jgi:hypothetical protein
VTPRSVLLGLAGVVFICGLTPYNDYAMGNTFLVGNFLPIGMLLFFAFFLLLVNAPLWRWKPDRALGAVELSVSLGMMLVACSLPSSGLMRYLPSGLVGIYHSAASNPDHRALLQTVSLPDWLLPSLQGETPLERSTDPVITRFVGRTPEDQQGFLGLAGVPWRAWVRPALTWGVLVALIYGAVLSLVFIVRRQWAENERLPFPLATVYLSLIETPPPGRVLNPLFSSRGFWIAFAAVFFLHGMNALHAYFPKVPDLPLGYNFAPLVAGTSLRFSETGFRQNQIYFVMLGITFLLQTRIAFSLWFFYVLYNVTLVAYPGDFTPVMRLDQSLGAVLVFAATVLWIGRHHWWMVLRCMFGRRRPDDPEAGYLPYGVAGWSVVACAAGIVVWLGLAGVSIGLAIAITVVMLTLMLLIARVVAETGLVFAQFPVFGTRAFAYATVLPAQPILPAPRGIFFSNWFQQLFTHDLRESLSPYALNATRTADLSAFEGKPRWRVALPFVGALALAMFVGYFVAGASMLWTEYRYAATLNAEAVSPINGYGIESSIRAIVLDGSLPYVPPRQGPSEAHSKLGHFLFGGALTAFLATMRFIFSWWPLHPVGFLLAYTYPVSRIWFSLFIGWLLKVMIVRFGGARMVQNARPFFLGLILGEAGAAAFWVLVSIVANLLGMEYVKVSLLPE